jgi:hypothetical protein
MEYGNNPLHEVLSEPHSRSQCSKIAYYKALMTKKLSGGSVLSRSAVVGLNIPVQTYEQKVEELRIQQTKLNDYLETLSKMLAARQQGMVAAFTVSCNFCTIPLTGVMSSLLLISSFRSRTFFQDLKVFTFSLLFKNTFSTVYFLLL